MTAPDVELRRAWRHLAGSAHDGTVDALLARHREPHRRYHTATHVMWVLRHVDDLHALEPVADVHAVRAAALFHDVVYDPQSSTNEADSAAVAAAALTAVGTDGVGWPPSRIAAVRALVLATAGHHADEPTSHHTGAAEAHDTAVLLDADLAILGGTPAEYTAYVTGVRAEYAHVSDDRWRAGRAAVLRGFLDRPTVYATATMQARRERRARANLTAELRSLEPDGDVTAR